MSDFGDDYGDSVNSLVGEILKYSKAFGPYEEPYEPDSADDSPEPSQPSLEHSRKKWVKYSEEEARRIHAIKGGPSRTPAPMVSHVKPAFLAPAGGNGNRILEIVDEVVRENHGQENNISDILEQIQDILFQRDLNLKQEQVAAAYQWYINKPRAKRVPRRRREQSGIVKNVRLINLHSHGEIANLLLEQEAQSMKLIQMSKGEATYTFQIEGDEHPISRSISVRDVEVTDVEFFDPPPELVQFCLVQVNYPDIGWWTGRYYFDPASEEQVENITAMYRNQLAELKKQQRELEGRHVKIVPSVSIKHEHWHLSDESAKLKNQRREIKRDGVNEINQMREGHYVIEDDGIYLNPEAILTRTLFDPNADEWRFPQCPILSMTSDIEVLQPTGEWKNVTIIQLGETGEDLNDPDHIVKYETEELDEQGENMEFTLDTWMQQYRLVSHESVDDQTDDDDYQTYHDDEDQLHDDEDQLHEIGDVVTYHGQEWTIKEKTDVFRLTRIGHDDQFVSEDELEHQWSPAYAIDQEVIVNDSLQTIVDINYNDETYELDDEDVVRQSQLRPISEMNYEVDTVVVYEYEVCRIDKIDVIKGTYELETQGGRRLYNVSDENLEHWCMVKETNKSHTIWKYNGVTKRHQKLIGSDGKARLIQLGSKNILAQNYADDFFTNDIVLKNGEVLFTISEHVVVYSESESANDREGIISGINPDGTYQVDIGGHIERVTPLLLGKTEKAAEFTHSEEDEDEDDHLLSTDEETTDDATQWEPALEVGDSVTIQDGKTSYTVDEIDYTTEKLLVDGGWYSEDELEIEEIESESEDDDRTDDPDQSDRSGSDSEADAST